MMKFSDALLLGLPEIYFTNSIYLHKPNVPKNGKECMGCLVGAALYAVGERHSRGQAEQILRKYWPWTAKRWESWHCPVCGGHAIEYGDVWPTTPGVATHLAAHYELGQITAEQIADIFRAVEPADVAEEAPEPANEYQCT